LASETFICPWPNWPEYLASNVVSSNPSLLWGDFLRRIFSEDIHQQQGTNFRGFFQASFPARFFPWGFFRGIFILSLTKVSL
jgi:hypothetical protein